MKAILRNILIVAGITALAFFLASTALQKLLSLSTYSGRDDSFSFSDFYVRTASHGIAQKSKDITVVSVGNLSRKGIAILLDSLSCMSPKVIALDLFFRFSGQEGDNNLTEAVCKANPIMLPCDVSRPWLGSFFYEDTKSARYCAINLSARTEGDVIRTYQPVFCTEEGTIDALGLAVADYLRPDLAESIRSCGSSEQFIRFDGQEFDVYKAEEILAGGASIAEKIRGRAVFVGDVDDPQDKHLTPADPEMPGLLIHAKITQTILADQPVHSAAHQIVVLISILICALFVSLLLLVRSLKLGAFASLLVRVLQLLLMYASFLIGYRLYVVHNYLLDFYLPLSMLGLGTLAFDLSYGFLDLFTKVLKKKK